MRKQGRPLVVFLGGVALMLMYLVPGLDESFMLFPTDRPEAETLRTPYVLLLAGVPLAFMAGIPRAVGDRGMLPNRVVVAGGATWVVPRLVPVDLLALALVGVLMGSSGVVVFWIFGGPGEVFAAGTQWIFMGPGFIATGVGAVLYVLWQQLRGIRMTPESITYWRGIGRIRLAWDELGDAVSANDVRDHEGYRKYLDRQLPGAKVVVPVERVLDVKLRVLWEDVDTPRLLLETDYFAVEPSALLTAILALRDDPGLRPLLGTRGSKVLFKGPPWRVRRDLYRTQQWWPKGAAPEGLAVHANGVVKEFQ